MAARFKVSYCVCIYAVHTHIYIYIILYIHTYINTYTVKSITTTLAFYGIDSSIFNMAFCVKQNGTVCYNRAYFHFGALPCGWKSPGTWKCSRMKGRYWSGGRYWQVSLYIHIQIVWRKMPYYFFYCNCRYIFCKTV